MNRRMNQRFGQNRSGGHNQTGNENNENRKSGFPNSGHKNTSDDPGNQSGGGQNFRNQRNHSGSGQQQYGSQNKFKNPFSDTNFQSNENNQQNTPHNQQNRQYQNKSQYAQTPPVKEQQQVRSGGCVACGATTVLVCNRCGDFYCSLLCQKKDWPEHRYICFEMPPLVHSSVKSTEGMPVLNGYQNREVPESAQGTNQNQMSQHRKWEANSNSSQNQPQSQQQEQPQKNRSTPPKSNQQQSRPQGNQGQSSQVSKSTPPPSTTSNDAAKPTGGGKNSAANIENVPRAPFPKNNSRVQLTAIRTSNRVCIRSLEKEDNDGYCAVIKAINDYGRTAGPLQVMPSRNGFAITDFNQDGLFYRVLVVRAKNENEIQVVYLDFGNEATKKLSELKEISKECIELKQYVLHANLDGVPFVKDMEKLDEYLKTFEDVEGKIVYKENKTPYCEIFLIDVEDSLNKKINLFIQKLKQSQPPQQEPKNEQTPQVEAPQQVFPQKPVEAPVEVATVKPQAAVKGRPSQIPKPVFVPPFETVLLSVKASNVPVMIVDNSFLSIGYFGCIRVEDKANLQAIQAYLLEYDGSGQPYTPKPEEYCLAFFEDGWYRAKAISCLPSAYIEVVFIDFLNESEVPVSKIRRYPMDLDIPCTTTMCTIEGISEEISPTALKYLQENITIGSQLKIDEVVGIEDNIALVKIKNISDWLAANDSP